MHFLQFKLKEPRRILTIDNFIQKTDIPVHIIDNILQIYICSDMDLYVVFRGDT